MSASSLPIGFESVAVSADAPAWRISGPLPPRLARLGSTLAVQRSERSAQALWTRLLAYAGTPLGQWFCFWAGGFVCRSWAVLLGPELAYKRLERPPPLRRNSLALVHENPCHDWFLCGNGPPSGQKNCELLRMPLYSRDSVGMLGARIGHFPVDKRVPETPGPFCFVHHSLLLVGKCLSFPIGYSF